MSAHRTGTPTNAHRKSTKGRRRFRVIGSVVASVLVIASVAMAVYIGKGTITGSAKSGAFTPLWANTANATKVVSSSDMTCAVVRNPDATLTLTITDALPGAKCLIAGQVVVKQETGAISGRIVGVDLNLATGWTATVKQGCGATVAPGDPTTTSLVGTAVQIEVAMTDQAALGTTTNFGSTSGLAIAPSTSSAPLQAGCV